MFTFKHGTHSIVGKIDDQGYTLILKRPTRHTYVHLDDLQETKDTALNHVASYEDKCKADQAEIAYCRANKWTYAGT
jgi:hypothetical protein